MRNPKWQDSSMQTDGTTEWADQNQSAQRPEQYLTKWCFWLTSFFVYLYWLWLELMTTEGPFQEDRGHNVSMDHLYKTHLKIRVWKRMFCLFNSLPSFFQTHHFSPQIEVPINRAEWGLLRLQFPHSITAMPQASRLWTSCSSICLPEVSEKGSAWKTQRWDKLTGWISAGQDLGTQILGGKWAVLGDTLF